MKETEIKLFEGDTLKILPESKSFKFKCCDCGLVHKVEIERDQDNILLSFYRVSDAKTHRKLEQFKDY